MGEEEEVPGTGFLVASRGIPCLNKLLEEMSGFSPIFHAHEPFIHDLAGKST